MPRRTYNASKGRRRPSDPRGEYSRAQVAQLTDHYVIRPKHPDRPDTLHDNEMETSWQTT
jgi:hypothetical protein